MAQSLALAIGEISVRQHDGLYSLNDLHAAAGGEAKHQPALFSRRRSTRELVRELGGCAELHTPSTESQTPLRTVNDGVNNGTYACRELVIAYAAWISAAFHLKVIRVFLAQVGEPRNPAIDYTRISPADKQAVRKAVAQRAGKDSTAYQTIYNALHTHFGVNSYHELADDALPEALEVIARHAADWELVEESPKSGTVNDAVDKMVGWVKAGNGYPVELFMPIYEAITEKMERIKARGMPPAIDPLNAKALVSARKAANDYFDNYRDAVKTGKPNPTMGELPPDVLHGIVAQALFDQRMLSYFDWTTGRMHTQLVPGDSSVFSFSRGDYSAMAENIPMERIPEALEALNLRVKTHIGAFSNYLQRNRQLAY